jgi:hypothetical protein
MCVTKVHATIKRSERSKYLLQGLEKPNPMPDQPHARPNNTGREQQKRDASGDIHIRGEVQVKGPIEITQKTRTENSKHETREKVRLVVEILGLIAVIVYAYFAYWQADMMQKIFDAGNRPYIGPNGGTITTMINQSDNKPFGMEVKSEVKNFGTVPGDDFELMWEVSGTSWPCESECPAACRVTPASGEPSDAEISMKSNPMRSPSSRS